MDKNLLCIFAAAGLCLCAVNAHVERRYHFVYELMNMTEAQSYCREKYSDLATVDDEEDVELLNSMSDLSRMTYSEYSHRAWIGLYDDISSWSWSLSERSFYKPGEREFRRWWPNEPNNLHGKEHCVEIYGDGQWNDKSCDSSQQPVCCDVTGSDVTFTLIDTSMSWTEAQSYCRDHHTDLASVRNMAENQKVKDLIPSGQVAWIGLSRESWKWTDGSKSSFRFWKQESKEPNNNFENETCVTADFSSRGGWEDWPCDYKRAFVCHSVLTASKQVIKVRMVKENSLRDLNDPAVMEAILKQVKQSLKDQGLEEDVKLSWRKQPDGKVFHKEKRKKTKKRKMITTKDEL